MVLLIGVSGLLAMVSAIRSLLGWVFVLGPCACSDAVGLLLGDAEDDEGSRY